MVKLAPGSLLKLLDGMNMRAAKPMRDHRSALLQVADILPAKLGDKDLWPKHGFFIKVSDSSRSIYVSLPFDQDDLVLSDKMQLGQFIYVDGLEPGSPVPVAKGVKPLPGRHPLVGTPEPIIRVAESGERLDSKAKNHHRRSSWGPDQDWTGCRSSSPERARRTAFDFKESIPVKERAWNHQLSRTRSGRSEGEGSSLAARRSSVSGPLSSRMADHKGESLALLRSGRSNRASEREPRTPTSLFSTEKKDSITPSPSLRNAGAIDSSPSSDEQEQRRSSTCHRSHSRATPKKCSILHMPLPAKLSALGKEAMQQRETARKVALQALRDSSAAESLVRALKMLWDLNTSARPDAPAACFDQFLTFHQEITQAVIDMETIQAATSTAVTGDEGLTMSGAYEDDMPILDEPVHNSKDPYSHAKVSSSKRGSWKPASCTSETDESKSNLGEHLRSNENQKVCSESERRDPVDDENRVQISSPGGSIRLAKQIQVEARCWFLDFVEAALEAGLKCGDEKKSGCYCSESLMSKVISWIEAEQSDSSKRSIHCRTAQVARRLRIRVKSH